MGSWAKKEKRTEFVKRKVETLLLNWKKRPDEERKPLLLNGARQVGKTYILRKFGEEQFSNVVYVNLEANLTVASFFGENISPERLIRYLESASGEKIVPGKSLLIFDEIQSCERALTSLKYFCEEAPQYHVAAAGNSIRFLWARLRRQRCFLSILKNFYGPEGRVLLLKISRRPIAPWSHCLTACISRRWIYTGNILS